MKGDLFSEKYILMLLLGEVPAGCVQQPELRGFLPAQGPGKQHSRHRLLGWELTKGKTPPGTARQSPNHYRRSAYFKRPMLHYFCYCHPLLSPEAQKGKKQHQSASGAILMMGAQGFLYLQTSKAFLHATFYQLSEDNANPWRHSHFCLF